MTTEVMMQTSRQLQDRLLCKLCEDVLNVGGEQWLLPLLARIDQTFPLLGIVEKFPPHQVDGEWKGYAAFRNPEIEVDKLIHFAMGVYWKASVHSWTGSSREPRIELGPYREKVRTFLRGETYQITEPLTSSSSATENHREVISQAHGTRRRHPSPR